MYRIADGNGLHPCRGRHARDGLLQVNGLFYDHPVTWIRIRRHPLDIAASFVALRTIDPHAARAKDADDMIVEHIRNESRLSAKQWPGLCGTGDPRAGRCLIQVRYEDFGNAQVRKAFAQEVAAPLPAPEKNRSRLVRALGTYGGRPAIMGRLGAGREDLTLSEAQKEWFRAQLADVIRAEGDRKSVV